MAYLQRLIFFSFLVYLKSNGAAAAAAAAAAAGFQCPEGMGCSPCYSLSGGKYEIRCATSTTNSMFIIKFMPNSWISVTCSNTPNWSEFHLGKGLKIPNIKEISFERCQLPSEPSLAHITKQLIGDSVEELTLEGNYNLTYGLNRNYLRGFKNITRLTLSNNQLTNLTSHLFDDLTRLTTLNLRENELQELPEGILIIPSLKSIELGSNRVETIKNTAFKSLENLELLNLWNNKLIEIQPGSFDNLKSLKSIDMHTNNLSSLPDDIFAKLPQLSSINLSQNNLNFDSLAPELFHRNTLLEAIIIVENKRNSTTLPKKFFANLRKLERVNIRGNKLIHLPEDLLINASNLQYFNAERNSIEKLDGYIFKDCKNLTSINLSENRLSDLPDQIFSTLDRLEQLDLSGNNLHIIKRNLFDSLSSLRVLNLERNGLRTIDPDGLRSLQNLRIAKFAANELTLRRMGTRINSGIRPMSPFSSCSLLETLDLQNNKISDIFLDWTSVLTNLKTLKLSHNRLQFLHAQDLMFLAENLEVDLSFNKIERISLAQAEKYALNRRYAKNNTIIIANNPIVCDCDIYDLLRYREGRMNQSVRNHFHLEMEDLRCDNPNWLKGRSLKELKSQSLTCLLDNPGMYDALCPESCECQLRPNEPAYIVNCAHRALTESPAKLRSPRGLLPIELNLTGNYLTKMPVMTRPGYDKVSVLILSRNRISQVSLEGLSKNIRSLALDSNNLTTLNSSVLNFLKNSMKLTNLNLEGNPWLCDCNARELLSFIQTARIKIPQLQKVRCALSESLGIFKMTPEDLCPLVTGWVIASCTSIVFLGLIIGGIVALYYRYQAEIYAWLYARQWCLGLITEEELDKDKLYDAFISFSHKDQDFVMEELVQRLEGGEMQMKLCIHSRDWLAGELIPTQIVRSVENSRRTIVILSPNFLESVWAQMEFRTAHTLALTEGRPRVIVILYGDIGPIDQLDPELRAYLAMNTYLVWGERLFWEKLRYSFPHNKQDVMDKGRRRKEKKTVFENQRPTIRIANDKSELIEDTHPNASTPPADTLKTFVSSSSQVDNDVSLNAETTNTVNSNTKMIENCNKVESVNEKIQVKKPQIITTV